MFFPRPIRQAKWVFALTVFGVGFVAFGVGGNIPGIGRDILQGPAPELRPLGRRGATRSRTTRRT